MTGAWLCLLPREAAPKTWHILPNGEGDAANIQVAIESAATNDTILVAPGTWTENLSIIGKDLVLKSELGVLVTTLDGSLQQKSTIYLSGQSRATVIEGFRITGGSGFDEGGGISIAGDSSPIIRGNLITNNGVSGFTRSSGGIAVFTSSSPPPLIEANTFEENWAMLGGAIGIGRSTEIRGNTFRNNSCQYDGGAIYAGADPGQVLTIENNQFWSNHAGDHGGAIYLDGSNAGTANVSWNLFVDNQAEGSDTGDTGSGGAIRIRRLSGRITNNTMVEGYGVTESICGGGALSLEETPSTLEIEANIFAYNRFCAISCHFGTDNLMGPNLFWMNELGDLGIGAGVCPTAWGSNQIDADPLFCNPQSGDYTVSIDSPALTGTVKMGVWTTPGCGPGVATIPTTWGHVKARYR